MKVKDIMIDEVRWIHSDKSLKEAAIKMRNSRLGALPVKNDGNLVGMITDRDIVVRAIAMGQDPNLTRVRDVMTPHIVSCYEDQTVNKALSKTIRNHVNRVVVLDHRGKLVGMLSLVPELNN